ncbi:starch synthase [Cohnella sp. CIP 111063]|uniref:glycogen synthase GlgA n=1 Tax=unclassified Cohnella TaxID=2636738 RepID=UPI000B8C6BC1|nr:MULTISPECIES: glycogen synthase GlgA [unclassified Cohnella]OXS52692.1 starch synthase [Cohnella sp. CIP 111063]PRX59225.1 starch synthase [Cohnella sp. SGD-V74]
MRVMFAASEAMPLVKTGGLADVAGALPKALAKQGAEVTVVLPKYGEIPQEIADAVTTIAVMEVRLGWRTQYCGVQEVTVDGVRFILIDNEFYFKRGYLYGYGDEAERFAFFSFAVLEMLDKLDRLPDILHCHDWQTGLIPFLLKTRYANRPGYRDIRTVFTIHNLQYQGVFSRELLQDLLSTGDDSFTQDSLEFYGAASCMKAGLRFADKLSTVSYTYAHEIQSEEYGEKLDGVIRQRAQDLWGILNGIDTDVYDPMSDPNLAVNYRNSLEKKRQNKLALQRELGLPEREDVSLVGIVSRLTQQKGFDLIAEALPELMELDVQLVVLGSGEPGIEAMLRDALLVNRDKMALWFGFNEGLARRIYAASDMYLMPSRFEPCGLSQLIALRYRSVPIVRETGGLKDTVAPYNEYTGTGNGFTFGPPTAHDMLYTIRRALAFYGDREHWERIVANGAKKDYGWESSAKLYCKLYRELVS